MTRGSSTRRVLKTTAEVKNDLYKTVCGNARELLKEKTGEDLPDTADLDEIMSPLAFWRFQDELGFAFEKDPLMYKNKEIPDALPGTITPISQLCSITEGNDIGGFVDVVFLSKADFPEWMSINAKGALKTLAIQLTSQDTQSQCRFDSYEQSFDGDSEGEDSWRVKAVFVYLKGSLLEDDINADITVVYFLAIYYKTLSPTKTVRDLIRDEAFAKAITYTSSNVPISDISDLERVLTPFGELIFKETFQFSFRTVPPPGLDPNSTSPLNTGNSHLFYFQDLSINNLKETVNELLFVGLNIPAEYSSVQDKVLADIVAHFTEVLKDPTSGAWVNTNINTTYSHSDPTINSVRMNALVVYFYDNKVTDNGVSVANTYILCLCRIWEVLSLKKTIAQDIFKMMVNQLRQNQGQQPPTIDRLPELKGALLSFAKAEFLNKFGFGWDGDSSKPNDLAQKDGKVRGFEALAELPHYEVVDGDITDFIDQSLFTRETIKFPDYAREGIYDDLKNSLIFRTKNFPPDSMWDSQSQDYIYEAKSGQSTFAGQSIKVSTTCVYGLGEMSEQGVLDQIPFVYVLMVVRSTKEGPWA